MKARRRARRNPIGEAILGGVLGGTAGVLTDRVIWHSRANPSGQRHCSACGSCFHDKRLHRVRRNPYGDAHGYGDRRVFKTEAAFEAWVRTAEKAVGRQYANAEAARKRGDLRGVQSHLASARTTEQLIAERRKARRKAKR